jgi:hypothetical protein
VAAVIGGEDATRADHPTLLGGDELHRGEAKARL